MLQTLALKSAIVDSRSLWSLPPCRLRGRAVEWGTGGGGRTGKSGGGWDWKGARRGGWARVTGAEVQWHAVPRARGPGRRTAGGARGGRPAPEAGVPRAQQVAEQAVAAVLGGHKEQQLAALVPGRGGGEAREAGARRDTRSVGCRAQQRRRQPAAPAGERVGPGRPRLRRPGRSPLPQDLQQAQEAVLLGPQLHVLRDVAVHHAAPAHLRGPARGGGEAGAANGRAGRAGGAAAPPASTPTARLRFHHHHHRPPAHAPAHAPGSPRGCSAPGAPAPPPAWVQGVDVGGAAGR